MSGKEIAISNAKKETISHEQTVTGNRHESGTCTDIYQSVFEQTTDAIMISDFKGNFVDVNSSLCAMFGYTKEELLGLNVRSLIDAEHLSAQPIRFDLLIAGENLFTERKMLHKNGTVIYVEANSKRIIDNRILVIARDISRLKKVDGILKKSEANLHTIFDNTDTIYVLLDHDLRIISHNHRAAAFAKNELGHRIQLSKYFLDYFPDEKRPLLLSHMKAVLTGKHINYEASYPQPGGLVNWYYVRMFPISRGDNNVYGLMMAVSDITEKKVLEQKLEEERLKKQMEITDAVITAEENERHHIGLELHDNVNQLLVSARIYIGMAKRSAKARLTPDMDEADQFIDAAINEIRNLSHSLISPFLDEFGLIESLDYLTGTISKASGVIVESEMKIDEDIIEYKLKLSIYRIVQEQLNNILKHAKAKRVYLALAQVNEKVMLYIKDDGVGFDSSQKAKGIGLMNIRTRASLFNGQVNIISAPGNGCALFVSFN